MRLLDVLNLTTDYFEKHAVSPARLNAEKLIGHALNMSRMDLYLQFDRPVSEAERQTLRELLRRRAAGEPLQHILGEADFYGRTFSCSDAALIPRPETEILVETALALIPKIGEVHTVLDVGTGSGVIAITLALERPGLRVIATDVSEAALQLAKKNAEKFSVTQNVTFLHTDLLTGCHQFAPLDMIVANLPYLPAALMDKLPAEVTRDPQNALHGGENGLDLIARLIVAAPTLLRDGAHLLLEFHPPQADELFKLLDLSGFSQIRFIKDLSGRQRAVCARLTKPTSSPG